MQRVKQFTPPPQDLSPMKIAGNVVMINDVSFQLSQINSVRVDGGRFRPVAFLMMLLFWSAFLMWIFGPSDPSGGAATGGIISFVCAVAATYRFIDGLKRNRLILVMSSKEVAALESYNKSRVKVLAGALVKAISER